MINSDHFFVFFSSCFLVKGHNRSLIIDTQRNNYISVPETMYDVINLFKRKKSIQEIISIYGEESSFIINEYLDFLTENEFGILTNSDEFDCFPEMDTSFEIPSQITNSIIEISEITILNLEKIIQNLENFNCKNIQLISYDKISLKDFNNLLIITEKTNFKSVQLILKYSDEIFDSLNKIFNYNKRVTELILHSSKDKRKDFNFENTFVDFIDYELKSFNYCGVVDAKYFGYINKYRILESLNHNSCLNKKISISKNGDIKNCPGMKDVFGNIKEIDLQQAVNDNNFKKLWNIKKDQIETCKDCEFRHVCTDCRAFIEKPNNIYSKPIKCGYSPYDNTWEEWSTNPLKQEVINYYNLSETINK